MALCDARGLGHFGVKWVVIDGNGLRGGVVADGCRRALGGSGGGRGHGTGEGRRQVRDPERHCRGRRSLRRHGFQSRRNAQGNYRLADGYQGGRHHTPDHARGAGAGAAGKDAHPGEDGRSAAGTSRGGFGLCSAVLHAADSSGQDSGSDRTGRKDDSEHYRTDRREDRRGRFRQSECVVERPGVSGEGTADYRRPHGDGGGWEDVPGDGIAPGGFRSVC